MLNHHLLRIDYEIEFTLEFKANELNLSKFLKMFIGMYINASNNYCMTSNFQAKTCMYKMRHRPFEHYLRVFSFSGHGTQRSITIFNRH